jgi:hypothetical protein
MRKLYTSATLVRSYAFFFLVLVSATACFVSICSSLHLDGLPQRSQVLSTLLITEIPLGLLYSELWTNPDYIAYAWSESGQIVYHHTRKKVRKKSSVN